MLRKIELVLTVVSIIVGTYEILGRTDVVSGPTPIEAVQDAMGGGDGGEDPALVVPTVRPPEQLQDLTPSVQRCDVFVDVVAIELVALSDRPIQTGIDGVQLTATSGAHTDSGGVMFNNATESSGRSLSLMPGEGTHTITVVVDGDDRYEETDESNNARVLMAEVPPSDSFDDGTCSAL